MNIESLTMIEDKYRKEYHAPLFLSLGYCRISEIQLNLRDKQIMFQELRTLENNWERSVVKQKAKSQVFQNPLCSKNYFSRKYFHCSLNPSLI